MLDVRGAMNLEDASGAAVVYFPAKAKTSSFFIRCADDPSQYSKDQERFFVGSDGKVGVGTSSPSHGLTISSEKAAGDPLNDVAIMKGSLHLSGAIYDTFGGGKKYFIDLKKESYLKTVNVESMLGVGTAQPKGLPGSDAAVHIQGEAPVMRIENTKAEGTAAVTFVTGSNKWDIEGSTGFLKIKNNGKTRFTISSDGKIGVGEQATNPSHGLTLATDAPVGDDRNDLSIQKGNLGVGLMGAKPKFALHLGQKQVFSIGDQLFMAGSEGKAFISANALRVDGKWSLHNNQDGAAAMEIAKTGMISLLGSKKNGSPQLEKMFTIDAKSQTATFPMVGMKAGFGTSNPSFPLQVNGATDVGNTKASLAFGMAETSMGYLGSNDKYVYMATSTGQEVIALDHSTGYVGIGTGKPKSTLHLASSETPSMSFGSTTQPDTHAYIKAQPAGTGLNMIFGIKNPVASGGKLTFDFKNEMKFGGSGPTIFSRGDTVFKTGNVGIGGSAFDDKFKLHVIGDMKVDGKCWVAATRPSAAKAATTAAAAAPATKTNLDEGMLSELDLTDLLQEGEQG